MSAYTVIVIRFASRVPSSRALLLRPFASNSGAISARRKVGPAATSGPRRADWISSGGSSTNPILSTKRSRSSASANRSAASRIQRSPAGPRRITSPGASSGAKCSAPNHVSSSSSNRIANGSS